jgi:putative aldouronate transport system substrate-binding protein
MSKRALTRRDMLRLMGGVAGTPAVMAMLAACGAAPAPAGSQPTAVAPAASAVQAVAADCPKDWTPTLPAFDKFNPPIQISVPFPVTADFPQGGDFTDNPMYNRIRDHLGIEYLPHWQAVGSQREEKLRTDIAAGTLPDMFAVSGTLLSLMIENEAVEEISDIWDSTASDLTKEKKLYPRGDNWIPTWRGDRLYGVAFSYGPGYNVDNLGHIRQDWLDQLGLPMPTTIDELTTALKAFNEAGLCQYGINACRNLVTWYQSLDPIFGAYGAMPTIWRTGADGTLVYGSIQPEVKEALAVIRGWYADGLMDPDFFTYSEGDSAGHVGAERVGVFFAPWWAAGGLITNTEKSIEGADLAIMPAPIGPGGRQGRKASPVAGPAVVFRKGLDPEKIRATIQHLNWQMDMHVNWQDYQQYGEWRNGSGLLEGYEWNFDENCEIVEGDVINVVQNTYIYVNEIGFTFPWICYPEYQAEVFRDMREWLSQDRGQLNQIQSFLLDNPRVLVEMEYYLGVADTLDVAIETEFLGNNTERMTRLLPDLQQLESEALISIIIGNESLDYFDEFVAEWKASGGDEVTEDVNGWKASMS